MNCESCGHENLEDARFCAKCGVQLTSAEGESWVGRLVGGRFKVTNVLGEGGMGVVYAAEQQMGSSMRKAAIKTLHPHLSQDASVVARFNRECGTVAQLEHPNTIKVFDFGDQDGTLYIAMEYVEGKSLDKVLSVDGPMSPSRAVNILEQICGALDEAHEQGVIHRDLKPENIILGERLGKQDFVKVLDFGIAARTESADAKKEQKLTQQGMVLGTPPYMSPEQFTGEELDRRSDVYSLGVMAYEMLTGRLPFTANTPWQWATEHMTAQPFPIEQVPTGAGIPGGMREAVMQALSKEPSERPATAAAFVQALQDGVSGSGDRATASTEAMQAVPAFATGAATGTAPLGTDAGTAATGAGASTAETVREPDATGVGAALSSQGHATDDGIAATQAIAVPKKSNAGLILGLVAVVGVAAGALLVFTGGGGAPEEEPDDAAAQADEEGADEPKPEEDDVPANTGDGDDAGGDATKPAEPEATATTKPPTTTTTTKPPSTTTTPATTTKPPTTKPQPTSTPEPAKPKVDCSTCVPLVSSGSWSKAVGVYKACDASTQSSCRAHARRQATSQVSTASKAGKCSRARSIASSARQMGVTSSRIDKAAASCK